MRDLVRARATVVRVTGNARQHLQGFLLRHGWIYPWKKGWTKADLRKLATVRFEHPAQQIVLQYSIHAVTDAEARIDRLTEARARRAAAAPELMVLPIDLPALYRVHIDDLAATLSDEDVSGRASEELHSLIDTVVVDWDEEEQHHRLELRGKLLELLETTKPAGTAGLAGCESSLKLVAGA